MFLPTRHIAALGLLFVSLVGVLTISYFQLLDVDRFLVEVDHCALNCTIIVGTRCLSCGQLLTKSTWRIRRSPSLSPTETDLHEHYHHVEKEHLYPLENKHYHEEKEHYHHAGEKEHYSHVENEHYPHVEPSVRGCRKLTPCLEQCSSGLVNICLDSERRAETDYAEEEPLCEVDGTQVIGHAGGDPVNACENTLEATLEGLEGGMEAVHLDISVSRDMIPFLWRDHDPRSLTARLRQIGSYGVMGCRPALVPDTLKPAHLLPWETIESAWFYVNTTTELPADHQVITFKEWLEEMKYHLHRINRIWLEFRMPKEYLRPSILKVWELAKQAGAHKKLFFQVTNGEVTFSHPITIIGGVDISYISLHKLSTSQWDSVVYVLEEVQKKDPTDTVYILNREDEVVYALMVEKISKQPNILSQELKSVLDTSRLDLRGINFQVHSMDKLVENAENIVDSRDKITRDTCNPSYSQVAAWTVNNGDIASKLVCLHIDYIITDYPARIDREINCDEPLPKIEKQENCPEFCPRIYLPVCGSDDKTYSNHCMMRFHACEKSIYLTKKHDGKCDESIRLHTTTEHTENRPEKRINDKLDERKASSLMSGRKLLTQYEEGKLSKKMICDYTFCHSVQTYEPVCGKDGFTYDTMCNLLQTRCYGRRIELKHVGPCQQNPCQQTCSEIEDPVCGTDRKSYMNHCSLDRSICLDRVEGDHLHLWHRGECEDCNFICTREYRPVCGSDGNSYPNKCTMESETCRKGQPVWMVHDGKCSQRSKGSNDRNPTRSNNRIKETEEDDIDKIMLSIDNELSALHKHDFYIQKVQSAKPLEKHGNVEAHQPRREYKYEQQHVSRAEKELFERIVNNKQSKYGDDYNLLKPSGFKHEKLESSRFKHETSYLKKMSSGEKNVYKEDKKSGIHKVTSQYRDYQYEEPLLDTDDIHELKDNEHGHDSDIYYEPLEDDVHYSDQEKETAYMPNKT